MVTPLVASVSTTLKLLVTFCTATFCTVTLIVAVLPFPIDAGALSAVTATSVDGALTVTAIDAWLFEPFTSV